MSAFVSYLLPAYVLIIGICLLLSLVWLVLRVINAAVVLCHSACSFARSLVVMAFPAKPNSTTIATAGTLPSPARLASPAEDASPAGEKIVIIAGENADRVGNGSAHHRQHGSAGEDHPDAAGEDGVVAGAGAVHVDEVLATPLASTNGVARGRQPTNGSEYGLAEGVAKGRHVVGSDPTDSSAEGCPKSAEAAPFEWRPLATRQSPPQSAMLVSVPAIPEPVAAMRFRIWLLQFGLEQIGRAHGDLIATVDVWELAQRFAQGSGFRIDSHDRFFEALRKLPGVGKETDRWVTRLRGSREKRVAYSFRPAVIAGRTAVYG